MKRNYINTHETDVYRSISEDLSRLPFSFIYNGTKYTGFSPEFFTVKNKTVDKSEDKETQIICMDFLRELEVSLVFTHYFSHGVTEWTVWFCNTTNKNSGIIEKPETTLTFEGKYPMLKGILGDHVNKYSPYAIDMQKNTVEFSSDSGRATHINFPYFNLEYGNGGSFVALGWPGTWEAEFTSISKTETRLICGQRDLATKLAPGESIRTPLVAFLIYEGRNTVQNMNLWRRWFIDCNMRHVEGEENIPLKPVFSTSTLAQGMDESKVLRIIRAFEAHNVPVDYFWLDAGWYVNADGVSGGWPETGTLQMDTSRFPTSLRAVSDELASYGGKLLRRVDIEFVSRKRKNVPAEAFDSYVYFFSLRLQYGGVYAEPLALKLCQHPVKGSLYKASDLPLPSDRHAQDTGHDPAHADHGSGGTHAGGNHAAVL